MPIIPNNINEPEIFIGLVAPIGTHLQDVKTDLTLKFRSFGYEVKHIKVTEAYKQITNVIKPAKK